MVDFNIALSVAFGSGLVLGALLTYLLSRSRLASTRELMTAEAATAQVQLEERLLASQQSVQEAKISGERLLAEVAAQRENLTNLHRTNSELSERLRHAQSHTDLLQEVQNRFTDAFRGLSAEALKSNNQSFLELAKATLDGFQESAKIDLSSRQEAIDSLVKPISESLTKVDSKIQEIETSRAASFAALGEQLKAITDTHVFLKEETSNLVKALRAPAVRGRWGEMQLKRVVELAGMVAHCDFVEQSAVDRGDSRMRPDLVINLPGRKSIVVDAKVPLQAYLEALEAVDEDSRREKLREHAFQLRQHLLKLGKKDYWEQFTDTPELAILFLPGESFYGAALEQDPALIEFGVERKVLLATPTTLIALLKSVAYGWRQENLSENAQVISQLGKELHERLRKFVDHLVDIRRGLDKAVDAYNGAVRSLESRVLPTARRFKELGAGVGSEIEVLENIDKKAQEITAFSEASPAEAKPLPSPVEN